MSVIKEFREFFLRKLRVTSGAKKDNESNYPTTYTVTLPDGTTRVAYNRFLKDHFPSEDVFRKLFESVVFKLNQEDTALETMQGGGKLATDAQSWSGDIIDSTTEFSRIVVPSQLPTIAIDEEDLTVNTLGTVAWKFRDVDTEIVYDNLVDLPLGARYNRHYEFGAKTLTWQDIVLEDGVTFNVDTPPQCEIFGTQVLLKGVCTFEAIGEGVFANGDLVGTLPVGYAPPVTRYIDVTLYLIDVRYTFVNAVIMITPGGSIYLYWDSDSLIVDITGYSLTLEDKSFHIL